MSDDTEAIEELTAAILALSVAVGKAGGEDYVDARDNSVYAYEQTLREIRK